MLIPNLRQQALDEEVRKKTQGMLDFYHANRKRTALAGVSHRRDTRIHGHSDPKWLYEYRPSRISYRSKSKASNAEYDLIKERKKDSFDTRKGKLHRAMVAEQTINVKQ